MVPYRYIAIGAALAMMATLLNADDTFTGNSIINQRDDLNQLIKTYLEFMKEELAYYDQMENKDKEIQDQVDAAFVVHKLVEQSWLHSMKPDKRYYIPKHSKTLKEEENLIVQEIKEINNKIPVADAILLYTDVEDVFRYKERKEQFKNDISILNDNIEKAKASGDIDKIEQIQKSKQNVESKLKQVEEDLYKSNILREMFLQSYVLDFGINCQGNTLQIKHSVNNKVKEFPIPLLDSLSILETIKST